MKERIACLVRGGEVGRRVQERAIAYALQNNQTIVFLHVIDLTQINPENEKQRNTIRTELVWLGKVILNMARRRAKQAGVKAEGMLLSGTVLGAAQEYLSRHPCDRVLIGSPHPNTLNYTQRLERIHQFAKQLEASSGIPVEIIFS